MIGGVVLATRTWESPALTRAALDALSGDGVRVTAASVRLSLWRGVELRDLAVDAALTDGRLHATAAEAVLSHRLRPLLHGEVLVEKILLRRPQVEIVWAAEGAPLPAAEAAPVATEASSSSSAPSGGDGAPGRWTLDLRVDRFGIEDGQLVMREEGVAGEMVRVEGLALELRELALPAGAAPALTRVTGGGELTAERLVTEAIVSRGATAKLRLAQGHLLVETLALPTDLGPITVEVADLDLNHDPYVYSLHGVAQPIDTNKLLAAKSGFGPATLTFALDGDGSDDGGPRGKGRLEVAAGSLGALPALAAVERLFARGALVGSPYTPFAIDYALDGNLLTLQPFAVEAGNLRLGGAGRIDLEGPLDLHLEVTVPRDAVDVAQVPKEVLTALTDVDGRVKLPIVVRGTLEAPSAGFDRRAWAALARRRLVDEAGRRLGNALGRLLDRHG